MKPSMQKPLMWAVILSESSHVFCCVFPTVFSVISLLTGLGMVAAMPTFMVSMHSMLHAWELPMIGLSGLILALGWGAVWYSDRVDCHSTGCVHGSCAPKKNKAHIVLKVATVLFFFNILIFATLHKTTWFADRITGAAAHSEADHHGHTH